MTSMLLLCLALAWGDEPATPTSPSEPPPAADAPPPKEDLSDLESELGTDDFEVLDVSEDPEALKALLQADEVQAAGPETGRITGRLVDTNGAPVSLAVVSVQGSDYKTTTDLDGRYELTVPPGTWVIEVTSQLHASAQVPDVVVVAGGAVEPVVVMQPTRSDVVVVEESANKEAEGGELIARQSATASTDAIGRADFSRSTGDTAQLTRRVVAATVIDGRFVFVRGLGHRYGNTLLDGVTVPSPEPELRTVPLDMFPQAALSAIVVQKTFTADVPGDFTGGSIRLETRDLPDEEEGQVSVWFGDNTATTFRPFVRHDGYGAADAFGFGNRPRDLPATIPSDLKAGRGITDPSNPLKPVYTPEQIEAQGESLDTRTSITSQSSALPNFGLAGSWGRSFDVSKSGRLGLMFAGTYQNQRQTWRELVRVYGASASGEPQAGTPQTDYDGDRTVQTVQWNAMGLVKWVVDSRNRLSLTGLYSRDAEDETRQLEGTNQYTDSSGGLVRTTRLRYVARSLAMATLKGAHTIGARGTHDLKLDWFGAWSRAERDDPAIREMVFTQTSDQKWIVDPASSAGRWTYLGLRDDNLGAGIDLAVPFDGIRALTTTVKLGARVDDKERDYGVRRLSFNRVTGLEGDIPLGTGDVFNADTIGGGVSPADGGTAPFVMVEQTQANDNYAANSQVVAGYGMLDLPMASWVTLNAGARVEWFRMHVRPYDFQTPDGRPDIDCAASPTEVECYAATLQDTSVLPAVSLKFAPDLGDDHGELAVRLSATRTIARPEFRELAPFRFTDFVGGWDKVGYANLQVSHAWNADLRVEWFPNPGEVIAATAFFKAFDQPIEQVAGIGNGGAGLLSWENLDHAVNVGGEIELGKKLGFLAKADTAARRVLNDFTLGGNVAIVWSRVTLPDACYAPGTIDPPAGAVEREDCRTGFTAYTSAVRALQGQSPYSVNAYLDYDNERSGTNVRVLYNGVGRYIEFVGTNNNADVYREAVHALDLTFGQRVWQAPAGKALGPGHRELGLRVAANNLLNWPLVSTQGTRGAETWSARRGTDIVLSLQWRH